MASAAVLAPAPPETPGAANPPVCRLCGGPTDPGGVLDLFSGHQELLEKCKRCLPVAVGEKSDLAAATPCLLCCPAQRERERKLKESAL